MKSQHALTPSLVFVPTSMIVSQIPQEFMSGRICCPYIGIPRALNTLIIAIVQRN